MARATRSAKKAAPAKKKAAAKRTTAATTGTRGAKKAPTTATSAAKATTASKGTKASRGQAGATKNATTHATAAKRAGRGRVPLDRFLEGQLRALEEERATYTRQATSLRAEADLLAAEREPGDVQFDEESGEGDTLAVERERDLALSAQAAAAVEEIDLAIGRIQEGTYGTCMNCGSRIPKERLRALPYAALCVQCKSGGFARR